MRHGKKIHKLSKFSSQRKALLRTMAQSLFKYESIRTTVTRAKALKPFAEKLITKAKTNDLHHKRLVAKHIKDRDLIVKLFEDIAERYKNRPGGYTRIYRLGFRDSDGSEMALLELVPEMLDSPASDVEEETEE